MSLMKSWVDSANSAETPPFPLNNLPYGVFSTAEVDGHCGVAIGDMILDVTALEEEGLIEIGEFPVFDVPFWNELMELGAEAWTALRARLVELLAEGAAERDKVEPPHLVVRADADMHMPFLVSEYTDFYAGRQHAANMGAILRGSPDLPANWLHIPIGYNGRASSVVVSGTPIHRPPNGQRKAPDAEMPSFGPPSMRLDIELEMGAIVGKPSEFGQPITVDEADDMIFGYVLLNDWSARDIQAGNTSRWVRSRARPSAPRFPPRGSSPPPRWKTSAPPRHPSARKSCCPIWMAPKTGFMISNFRC